MAISTDLNQELLRVLGVSTSELSRRAQSLSRNHGPMTGDEARYILAHEAGIDLAKFGVSPSDQDRVRILRSGMQNNVKAVHPRRAPKREAAPSRTRSGQAPGDLTPAATFAARCFHHRVVQAARKPYVNRLPQDAVLRALKSVNNRVKKLAGTSLDGQALMAAVFSDTAPVLQATDLSSESETNEQAGYRFVFMGAMRGLRNPRAHEDHWGPDEDDDAVLETLGLASLLHRFLDRCEARM